MFNRKRAIIAEQVAKQAAKLMDEAWEGVDWRSITEQAIKTQPGDALRQFKSVANAQALRKRAITKLRNAIKKAYARGEKIAEPDHLVFTKLRHVSIHCDTPTSIVSTVAACNAVAYAHLNAAQPDRDSRQVLQSCWRLLGKYQEI